MWGIFKTLMLKNKPPVAKYPIKTPKGIIRRGQRKPYRKATAKEVQDRTEWVALTLSVQPRLKDGELKILIKEQFNLEWREAMVYVARAKKLIRDRANMTKEQAKEIVVNSLINNLKNGSGADRNGAARILTEIFGNAAPTQHRVGDPDGKPLATTVIAPTVQFVLPGKEQMKLLQTEEERQLVERSSNGNAK